MKKMQLDIVAKSLNYIPLMNKAHFAVVAKVPAHKYIKEVVAAVQVVDPNVVAYISPQLHGGQSSADNLDNVSWTMEFYSTEGPYVKYKDADELRAKIAEQLNLSARGGADDGEDSADEDSDSESSDSESSDSEDSEGEENPPPPIQANTNANTNTNTNANARRIPVPESSSSEDEDSEDENRPPISAGGGQRRIIYGGDSDSSDSDDE
jgi:hypothetical protein